MKYISRGKINKFYNELVVCNIEGRLVNWVISNYFYGDVYRVYICINTLNLVFTTHILNKQNTVVVGD